MATNLAVIGDTCSLTVDGADHRAYEFTITKSGSRVSCKAFVDGPGINPEISTGVGTELVVKFRDDITQEWDINDEVQITYQIGDSTEVSGTYIVLTVESPNPAEGLSDFSSTFKYAGPATPAS
jgi:hypothetical protein